LSDLIILFSLHVLLTNLNEKHCILY